MAMFGANTQELRELATTISNAAQALRDASGGVSTTVSNTPWRGKVADQFRARWQSAQRSRIESAAAAIDEAAAALRRNADEQDRASGVGSVDSAGRVGDSPVIDTRQMPGLGSTREEVEAWWNGLSEEEQAVWLRDHPDMVGNRDGIPLDDRFAANQTMMQREIERLLAESGGSSTDLEALQKLLREGTRVLHFEADYGVGYRIAVALGDLENAEEVAITVSGTGSDLGTFANNFYPESVGLVDYDRNRAVIATLVWTPPPDVPGNAGVDYYTETMITGGAMDSLVNTASAEFGDVVIVSHSAGTDAVQTWATRSSSAQLVDGYLMLAAPDPDEAFLESIDDRPVVYAYHLEDPLVRADVLRPDNVADRIESALGIGDWGSDNVRFEYEQSGVGFEFSRDEVLQTKHHRNSAYFDNFGGSTLDSVFDGFSGSGSGSGGGGGGAW